MLGSNLPVYQIQVLLDVSLRLAALHEPGQRDATSAAPLRAAEAVHFVSSSALRVIRFARCVEMIVDWKGCAYEVEAAARSSSWMDDANEGADSPSQGDYLAYESGVAAYPGVGGGGGLRNSDC